MSQRAITECWKTFYNITLLTKTRLAILPRTTIIFLVLVVAFVAGPIRTMHNGEAGQADSQTSISITTPVASPSLEEQPSEPPAKTYNVAEISAASLDASNSSEQPAKAVAGAPTQQAAADSAPKPVESPAPPTKTEDKKALVPRGGERVSPKGVVVIDPGHGGKDIGANRTFPDGYLIKESDLTLKVGQKLFNLLKSAGFQAILTRKTDVSANNPPRDRTGNGAITVGDDLQARVDVANNANADLFVSVHFNSAASQMGGTEVFYCADRAFSDKSRKMAQFLQADLIDGIRSLGYDPPNRGVKIDTQSAAGTYLYVLGPKTSTIAKPIAMPSVLGEALFVSNQTEGRLLRDENTLNVIAEAYFKAVVQYFDWLSR